MAGMKKKRYLEYLEPLQIRLCELQRAIQQSGQRLLVLFEGRDTAGKGGAINCFSQVLNPRFCRVAALPKPNERERSQWFFQRYVAELPAAGEIVLFDRSWYNRGGVEKVMGFCSEAEYRRFLLQVPSFEKLLVDDGIILLKYWFAVDQEQQEQRFAERVLDPTKRWKISPIDLAARDKYDDYTSARDAFFKASHTAWAPWHVVDANDQRRARLNMIAHVLATLPAAKPGEPPLELPRLKRRRLGRDVIGAEANLVPETY
ncbi:MAG: polyphosphate kinase 2 [Lysobacterales bacterium]